MIFPARQAAVGVRWRTFSWHRLSLVVWTVLVVLAVGRAGLYHIPKHQGCYPLFADAGRHWLRGQDLYDKDHPASLSVYRYSPLVAAGLVPLALVSDPVGSGLLRAVNFLVFLPALWWWSRAALPWTLSREQRAGLFLLCAALGCNAYMDVQMNILTIGCLLLAMAAAARERWTVAAASASLACYLKAYPIAPALVLAVVFPRRFAGRWLVLMVAFLALPFLLQNPHYVLRQYQDWYTWGLNPRHTDNLDLGFQDLMLFCRRWLVPIGRPTYVRLELVSGAAVAGVCLLHRGRGLSRSALLHVIFGTCCAWMMALGPATEATTYVQLAPAVAAATLLAWTFPQRLWYRAALTVVCGLLVLSQLQLLFPWDRPLHHLAAQPAAALLFLVAAAVHGLGDRSSDRQAESSSGQGPLGRSSAQRGLPIFEGRRAA
jgi:hypothetical protein